MRMLRVSVNDHARPVSSPRSPVSFRRLLPAAYVVAIDGFLDRVRPGETRAADRYLAVKTAGALLALILGVAGGTSPVALLVLGVIALWTIPDLLLREWAAERERNVEVQLADVIDYLAILTEAGLSFEAAIEVLVADTGGPTADQMALVLRDLQHGLPRADALRGLERRTDSPVLRELTEATVDAEENGLPMQTLLHAHARRAREQRALGDESRANRLGLRLVVPVVVCVVPALLIVMAGPAILHIGDGLG
jgi:tight adherence protein C